MRLCPICKKSIDLSDTVQCDGCKVWHHVECVNLTLQQANELPQWYCDGCKVEDEVEEVNKNDDRETARSVVSLVSRKSAASMKSNLLKQKTDILRRKKELMAQELKLLDEEQKVIDEAIKAADEMTNKDEETESLRSKDIEGVTKNQKPDTTNLHHLKQLNKMTLEDKLSLLDTNIPTSLPECQQFNVNNWHARNVLPKELPKFSGAVGEWPLFINAFEYSTSLCELNKTENLLRLQRCLQDPAKGLVKHLLTDPNNVPEIIDVLRMLFGNAQRILKEQIEVVRKHDPVSDKDLSSIVRFSLAVKNLCATIRSSGLVQHLMNPMLVEELVGKLPLSLQLQWAQEVKDEMSCDITTLESWLNKLSRNICHTLPTLDLITPKKDNRYMQQKKEARVNVHLQPDQTKKCIACGNDCNNLASCKKFLASNDDERWKIVRKNYVCKQCLTKHFMKPPFSLFKCNSAVKCNVSNCLGRHHPLMHRTTQSISKVNKNEQPTKNETTCAHTTNNDKVTFRYLPVIVSNGEREIETIAFLDQGSSGTFIETKLAKKLKLSGPKNQLRLQFTGNVHRTENNSMMVSFTISETVKDAKQYNINKVHTVTSLSLAEQTLNIDKLAERYEYLRNIPAIAYEKKAPEILIGLNNWKLALEQEVRFGNSNGPIASRCLLGWTIYAGNEDRNQCINFCNNIECIYHIEGDDDLNQQVRQYFSVDGLGNRPPPDKVTSKEEQRALSIIEETIKRTEDSYEVGLLWKKEQTNLPDSKPMALNRLYGLEARFKREPYLKKEIGAKTRVAPLKLLSIPRLELTAALMGTRFSNAIIKSLTIDLHSTVYWSDSKTVLSWIRSDTKKIKGQFVAFRISEIQESTNTSNGDTYPPN